jgi:hypothetical protein
MNSQTAFDILIAAFITFLYLGMARLLLEVQALRRAQRLGLAKPASDGLLAVPGCAMDSGILIVAETDCESCHRVIEALSGSVARSSLMILVYEESGDFGTTAGSLPVLVDPAFWAAFAPMVTPALARVVDCQVVEMFAPRSPEEALKRARTWAPARVRIGGDWAVTREEA